MAQSKSTGFSTKRLMIDKANSTVVAVTAIACFVIIFSLVASWTLVGQLSYQNRVIGKKKVANQQLDTNIAAVDQLKSSYGAFVGTTSNIIGGTSDGVGAQDGDNAKIVLDALPSQYDFPALTTSLEKMLVNDDVSIVSITGTDDEVAQNVEASGSPTPVEIPFEISVRGDYKAIKRVIATFQQSIRPMKVQSMDIAAADKNTLTLTINATTYYQPEKALSIKKEVVR